MSEEFNPTIKEDWSILKAREIANFFGYCCTRSFKSALNDFILKSVIGATATRVLGSCAEGVFNNTPALRRKKRFTFPTQS